MDPRERTASGAPFAQERLTKFYDIINYIMDSLEKIFKSCFVSAKFGAELGLLPRVLDQVGIHWEWARSQSTNLERMPGDLRKIIRGVDFVLGVFFGGPGDANTMFEVGVALGIGKPVLLILATEDRLPYSLEGFPHLRASLNDEKAIAFHLDLLMRTSRRGSRYPSSSQTRSTATFSRGDPSIGKSAAKEQLPASALEAEIANLIEQAGGQVLLHPRPEGSAQSFRPDLLFWLPTRDAELLNPAVIELKSAPLTQSKLHETANQLFVFLQNTGVRTALLVGRGLGAQETIGFRGSPSQTVFFLDVETFRQLLRSGRLAEHLRQERNRAAHGLR